MTEKYADWPLIVGEDFNCHMGLHKEYVSTLENSPFHCKRKSLDINIPNNQKSKKLVEILKLNELVLLNGKSNEDCPLILRKQKKQHTAESIIELVWCSLTCINLLKNLCVLHLVTASDHLPIILTFNLSNTHIESFETSSKKSFGKMI